MGAILFCFVQICLNNEKLPGLYFRLALQLLASNVYHIYSFLQEKQIWMSTTYVWHSKVQKEIMEEKITRKKVSIHQHLILMPESTTAQYGQSQSE